MLISVAYVLVLAGLTVFGLHRLHLLWLLVRHPTEDPADAEPSTWPTVLVQLPLYNEATVAARLIDAVCGLDYPLERLEIQVLDDSTDETTELVAERVAWHRARGVPIAHVRRPERVGFKAGALAYGLERSTSELVAIFDADFVPQPGFLRRMVPELGDRSVGLVQAGWGHLNRGANLLTRLQALGLDAHFWVEQSARSRSGRFFNFNGTAGVWRRIAIETAGGWAADTITEDLDLSLRAQLCGWRFRFVEEVLVPAELPEGLAALRTQQERWARGSGQTARKLLREIWRAPDVKLRARIEATFQLSLNLAYPLLLLLALLTVPLVVLGSPPELVLLQWILFAGATGSVSLFYVASQRRRGWGGSLEAVVLTPALFCLGMGLSVSTGVAYLTGLLGGSAAFVRTPKDGATGKRYRARRAPRQALIELGLAAYAWAGLGLGLAADRPLAAPFLLLLALGFSATALRTLIPGSRIREPQIAPNPLTARPPAQVTVRRLERLEGAD